MLFDSNGHLLDTSNFTYLNEGLCAKVFRDNDIVLKNYKTTCKFSYYFSKKTFHKLKELNLPSIVKLYDYYYINNIRVANYLSIPEAYTMEYVHNPGIILLDQNKEYLLDITSKLEKDITNLAKNKIKMSDAHNDNIIFQENSAKIIDIDSFRIIALASYKKLLLTNKQELLYYIKSTLLNELNQQNIYDPQYQKMFNFPYLTNTSVTDYLNLILKDGNIRKSIIK